MASRFEAPRLHPAEFGRHSIAGWHREAVSSGFFALQGEYDVKTAGEIGFDGNILETISSRLIYDRHLDNRGVWREGSINTDSMDGRLGEWINEFSVGGVMRRYAFTYAPYYSSELRSHSYHIGTQHGMPGIGLYVPNAGLEAGLHGGEMKIITAQVREPNMQNACSVGKVISLSENSLSMLITQREGFTRLALSYGDVNDKGDVELVDRQKVEIKTDDDEHKVVDRGVYFASDRVIQWVNGEYTEVDPDVDSLIVDQKVGEEEATFVFPLKINIYEELREVEGRLEL